MGPRKGTTMQGPAQQPPDLPAVKRKRASKPKVKTGCLTCKIRRVKCDETKPSCIRCTSTGRKCDGYDKSAPPVKDRAAESLRGLAIARQEFIESYYHKDVAAHRNIIENIDKGQPRDQNRFPFQLNPNPLLRSLAADIPGTETERRFFHGFRTNPGVARNGLTLHVNNFSPFWRRLVLQLSHQDPAVKHALVALGAQYWLFERAQKDKCDSSNYIIDNQDCLAGARRCNNSPGEDTSSRAAIETFAVQQYNLSMSRLARLVADASASPSSSSPSSPSSNPTTAPTTTDFESTQRLALACCLVFVCIETLRSNGSAAITHLANGLRIIAEALPDEAIAFLAEEGDDEIIEGEDEDVRAGHVERGGVTETDMREIIRIFVRLEISAVCFSVDFVPVVQLKLMRLVRQRHERRRRRLQESPSPTTQPPIPLLPQINPASPSGSGVDFPTLRDAHLACCFGIRSLVVRLHEVRAHYADAAFWSLPAQQAAHTRLLSRLARLDARLRRFRDRHRRACQLRGDSGKAEMMSVWMDWIHSNTARAVAELMPGFEFHSDGKLVPMTRVSESMEALLRETVAVARLLHDAMREEQDEGGEDRVGAEQAAPRYTYDMVMIGPLYNVAVTTADPQLRDEALQLLRENGTREAFWEGSAIEAMVQTMNRVVEEGRWPAAYVPRSLGAFGAFPEIMGVLEGMDLGG